MFMKNKLILSLSMIALAAGAALAITSISNNVQTEEIKAETNEIQYFDVGSTIVASKGSYIELEFQLSSTTAKFGYEITFENYTWEKNNYSSYHQFMSIYKDGSGGAGYFFCQDGNTTMKFQAGTKQIDHSYDLIGGAKRTLRVDVDGSTKKYTITDSLGSASETGSITTNGFPTDQKMKLIHNSQMKFYGCRVWEIINNQEVERVDMAPKAYYDEEKQQVVTGIVDSVGGSSKFTETERATKETTALVTYMNGDKQFAKEAYVTTSDGYDVIAGPEDPEDYVFDGWYDAASGGNKVTSIARGTSGNITLYAHYRWNGAAARYIIGSFGESNWSPENGVIMIYDESKQEWSAQITLEEGDQFKVPYWNGSELIWDSNVDSYNALSPNAAAGYCFGDSGNPDHNFVCKASGTYTIYLSDVDYQGGGRMSVALNSEVTAEVLAAKINSFSATEGTCGNADRFPTVKAMFLELSSDEQEEFKSWANSTDPDKAAAYARYVAWATALGRSAWEEDAPASARQFSNSTTNNSAMIIVITASLLATISFAAFIRLKKRKTN